MVIPIVARSFSARCAGHFHYRSGIRDSKATQAAARNRVARSPPYRRRLRDARAGRALDAAPAKPPTRKTLTVDLRATGSRGSVGPRGAARNSPATTREGCSGQPLHACAKQPSERRRVSPRVNHSSSAGSVRARPPTSPGAIIWRSRRALTRTSTLARLENLPMQTSPRRRGPMSQGQTVPLW